jgi:predicted Zn-dependent peptidase
MRTQAGQEDMSHRAPHASAWSHAPDQVVTTLGNGARVVVLRLPHLATAAASVFVRSGSQHETARLNGIGHLIEHMAFKGTRTRDCQRINLDAERLGADVNAHTDKDHTAFHMHGLARDAVAFVRMLGDIVRASTFPAAELERERNVILHEYADVEDDAMAMAFRLFDRACFGAHPAARPVIGTRANIRRLTRGELVDWVLQQYTGANVIVGVAGNVDPGRIVAAARSAFGGIPAGRPNAIAPPAWSGGTRARRLRGTSLTHVVLGFPVPPLPAAHQAFLVAAALLGEGMSSPLLDTLRERRGLVYHADCWTDVRDAYGQFVIEASTTPAHLAEYLDAVMRMLRRQARVTDRVGLARARRQVEVGILAAREEAARWLELAALDLFALDRVRSRAELLGGIAAVKPADVRAAFGAMLEATPAMAIAGAIPRSSRIGR